MDSHEWANHITRNVDSDVRMLDSIIDKYRQLKDTAEQLRLLTNLEGETNRQVDNVAVALSSTSQELDSIASKIDGYTFDLRSAVATAWGS
ncbi:hypothetical protein E3O62_02410 [Cryobacterium sp. TMT2-15-1]|uniref:hypothetical protein n=1 Tax=Cryobacterium sp. TMT2-15-1 TaxID=1259246 RepID=UPI001069309E|nr:hypothetical protein [Cryobacterium sp. TMT2-15-1]TFC63699.1 hypothetical protein E3O62_02410 [Cryobacterium sp. TMT2-15-1]